MISKVFVGFDPANPKATADCARSIKSNTDFPVRVIPLYLETLQAEGLYHRPDWRFTRFLVPFLIPKGWALYCDPSLRFDRDIMEFSQYANDAFAVVAEADNSIILWNMDHPENSNLSPHDVNNRPDEWLNSFKWLTPNAIRPFPPVMME